MHLYAVSAKASSKSCVSITCANRQPTVDLANVNYLHGVVVSNLGMLDFSTKSFFLEGTPKAYHIFIEGEKKV
jgi:hypothetical protein